MHKDSYLAIMQVLVIDRVFSINKKLIRLTDERWLHMDQAIINSITAMIPNLLKIAQKPVWFDYDKEADVLYVSFRKPQDATDTIPVNDHILLRKHEGEIIGVTVLHASTV